VIYFPFQRRYDLGRELLKWIAIITMTIDHIGLILYPEYKVLRYIGRLAFPLFAYLLILGMESTRNVMNYFLRLFSFALISQVPFYLALGKLPWEFLNIFFSLSLGVIFVYFLDEGKYLSFLPLLASYLLPVDHGIYGIAVIFCLYILRKNEKIGSIVFLLIAILGSFDNQWNLTYGYFGLLALPIILLHNDERFPFNEIGEKIGYSIWRKYFFYFYYPLHLLIIYYIKIKL
jgi:hypothetical protein